MENKQFNDQLQTDMKIKNRAHLVEKLEPITSRMHMTLTNTANTDSLFIISKKFYLEILLDPQSWKVNVVKVNHNGSSKSKSDTTITEMLSEGDFIGFTQQLEGLQSIYQPNAESKIKSKQNFDRTAESGSALALDLNIQKRALDKTFDRLECSICFGLRFASKNRLKAHIRKFHIDAMVCGIEYQEYSEGRLDEERH